MARIYKYADKTWYDVPDSEAQQSVASGDAGMEKGQQLPVVNPDGQHVYIDSDEASKAFQTGYRFQTLEDLHNKYNSEMQDAMQQRMAEIPGTAFTANALGAATGGLSDIPGRAAFGDEYSQAREAAQQANPVASTLGTVAGLVAPSPLGEIATVGGLAAKAGGAVERGVASGLGESLTSKLVGHTLRGATEGAILGTGEGISDAILGKPDDAVDNLLAHVGHDALLGGAFGSAFGVGSEIAAPAIKSAALFGYEKGTDLVRRAANGGFEATLNATGQSEVLAAAKRLGADSDPAAFSELQSLYEEGGKTALDAAEKNVGKLTAQIDTQSNSIGKQLATTTDGLSKDAAANVKASMSAANNDVSAAHSMLLDQMKATSDQFDALMPELRAQPVPVTADAAIGSMDSAITRLGKTALTPEAKRMAAVAEDSWNQVSEAANQADLAQRIKQFREVVDARGLNDQLISKQVMGLRAKALDLVQDPGMGMPDSVKGLFKQFSDIGDARNALGSVIKGKSNSVVAQYVTGGDVTASQMDKVLNLLPDSGAYLQSLAKSGTSAVQRESLFKSVYQDYLGKLGDAKMAGEKALAPDKIRDIFQKISEDSPNIKRGLENMKDLGDLAQFQGTPLEKEVMLRSALGQDTSKLENFLPHQNRLKDLDLVAKSSTTSKIPNVIRAAAGFATGGKSEILMGAINAARNPYATLQKLAKMKQIADKGAAVLSTAMDGAAKALLSGTVEKTARAGYLANKTQSEAEQTQKYQMIRDRLVQLSSPAALSEHMASATSGSVSAPNIKMALTNKLANSVQYLKTQLPQDPLAGTSLFANSSNYVPSMAEISRFNRQINAVQDPVSVIHRVTDGSATTEELDALKTVHPGIYNRLQTSVTSAIMDRGTKGGSESVPYDRRVQISTMFGTPADYTMRPDFIQAMQNNLKPADEGGRPSGAQDTSSRKPRLDLKPLEFTQTDADKIAYKDQD